MDICEQTGNFDETSDAMSAETAAETFLNNTASQIDGTSSFELWKKGNLGILCGGLAWEIEAISINNRPFIKLL